MKLQGITMKGIFPLIVQFPVSLERVCFPRFFRNDKAKLDLGKKQMKAIFKLQSTPFDVLCSELFMPHIRSPIFVFVSLYKPNVISYPDLSRNVEIWEIWVRD